MNRADTCPSWNKHTQPIPFDIEYVKIKWEYVTETNPECFTEKVIFLDNDTRTSRYGRRFEDGLFIENGEEYRNVTMFVKIIDPLQ